jgi:hypothetical protein
VGKYRAELEASGEIPKAATRTGSDGRVVNVQKPPLRIDQLESKVKHWLEEPEEDEPVGLDGWIEMLSAIKEKEDIGKWYLEQIDSTIMEEYRKGDLIQACNNVLEQMRQQQRQLEQAGKTQIRYCPTCGHPAELTGEQIRDFYSRCTCPGCGYSDRPSLWRNEPGEWHPNNQITDPCPACGEHGFESHNTIFGHGVRCNSCRLIWPYSQFRQLVWQGSYLDSHLPVLR